MGMINIVKFLESKSNKKIKCADDVKPGDYFAFNTTYEDLDNSRFKYNEHEYAKCTEIKDGRIMFNFRCQECYRCNKKSKSIGRPVYDKENGWTVLAYKDGGGIKIKVDPNSWAVLDREKTFVPITKEEILVLDEIEEHLNNIDIKYKAFGVYEVGVIGEDKKMIKWND